MAISAAFNLAEIDFVEGENQAAQLVDKESGKALVTVDLIAG